MQRMLGLHAAWWTMLQMDLFGLLLLGAIPAPE